MVRRLFPLGSLIVLLASPSVAARTRRDLVLEARDLLSEALDINDETGSDCQMVLEQKLRKVLRFVNDAQRGSDRALHKAIDKAREVHDSAIDDCGGENTRATLIPLNKAIRKLSQALHPDQDSSDSDPSDESPPRAPPPSTVGIQVGSVRANASEYNGEHFAQIDVYGLHLLGVAGRSVAFSVAVKTFSGSWLQPVTLAPVTCDYDDCAWDQPVGFAYPEELLRSSNLDDGRFVALLTATDAQSGQSIGSRDLEFRYYFAPPPSEVVEPVEQPAPVISVELEPPIGQPTPIAVAWAPPPMLVEVPPPEPATGWFWVGGYWAWQGEWVWVSGHWRAPPAFGYVWFQPYYENREGWVVFIPGFWQVQGSAFVPPAPSATIVRVEARPGVVIGPRPIGPSGIFVPAPPGSRPGIIVPAPVGTPPAVVTSAPPVVRAGMRIQADFTGGTRAGKASVTIVAPSGVTASGRAVQSSIPVAPHLAAALTPVVRVSAPPPATTRPVPAFVAGRPPPELPKAQVVRAAPASRSPTPLAQPVTPNVPQRVPVRPGQPPPPPSRPPQPVPSPGRPGQVAPPMTRPGAVGPHVVAPPPTNGQKAKPKDAHP